MIKTNFPIRGRKLILDSVNLNQLHMIKTNFPVRGRNM